MTLRILHVSGCLGGVETWLRLHAEYHDPAALHLSFVLPSECDLSGYARARGMGVHIVPMERSLAPRSDVEAFLALQRVIRDVAPDIVHLHSSKAGLLGRIGRRDGTPRVVYTPHAYFYLGRRGALRWLFLLAERLLDRRSRSITLGTSPSEERRAIEDVGCPPSRVSHVMNAVECDLSGEPRQPDRGGRGPVVLVARVGAQKNIPMFLAVVRRLKAHFDVDFCLVGVGHYANDRALLQAMIRSAGLEEGDLAVIPWASREELLGILAGARVVVLTSSYESFGYVLAEANCLGVPVIGTDVDGIRDVIEDGVNGFLVPPDDDRAMAARIVQLTTDAALWSDMSSRAADVARARFDIRRATAALEDFYRGVAHAHG